MGNQGWNGWDMMRKGRFCICWPCKPTEQGKDIVFRFIIEYSSLRDFGPYVIIIGLFIFIWGFLKDDILACVETWD